ncbi:MAG: tRNA (adenosine(37)-N6)-threonylcarbamoyltransferase complex dimerization subunit type 1 TsaB [Hyphomicrobiales bacterium]|nr:tRNA (adenosine(37)-N6)-threonylcarbamoyltransferase complex dimerization subunit type 1 TsaB [Hyphomicrobiales bacterium]
MNILAIDTSLGAAAACVLDAATGATLAQESIAMARGHDEAIVAVIERVCAAAGGLERVGKVAVTVGPGSFTGIRVGLSAARAIGLAAGVPVVGVSSLAAYCAPIVVDFPAAVAAAAIDARHGRVFLMAVANGKPVVAPRLVGPREGARMLGQGPIRIAGSGAMSIAIEAWSAGAVCEPAPDAGAPDIAFVARLGAAASPETAPARPLYLKAPDVKIPASAAAPRA